MFVDLKNEFVESGSQLVMDDFNISKNDNLVVSTKITKQKGTVIKC